MKTVSIEIAEQRKGFWVITVNGHGHGWANNVAKALEELQLYAQDLEDEAVDWIEPGEKK